MATGVISDFEINNFVRRELVVRRLDTSCLKFGASGGVVYVNGTIKFIGAEVTINEMPKYLYLLEQSIRGIRGVRNVKMEFEGWVKNKAGKWMQAKDDDKKKHNKNNDSDSSPQGTAAPPPVQPEIPVKKPSENKKVDEHEEIVVKSFPCRNCGHWVLKGIDFCENCGSKNIIRRLKSSVIKCTKCDFISIKPISGDCPECGEKLEQVPAEYYASKCDHCGYVKKWILNFCPECGFDLSKNEKPEEKPAFEEIEETPVNEKKEISLKEKVKMLLEQEKENTILKKSKKINEINDLLGKI